MRSVGHSLEGRAVIRAMNAEPLMPADILTCLRILMAPRRRCRGAACPGASGTWPCSGRPPQTPAELHPGARIRGGDRPASASRPGIADRGSGDSAARFVPEGRPARRAGFWPERELVPILASVENFTSSATRTTDMGEIFSDRQNGPDGEAGH